jgi:hypothetical protein
LYANHVMLILNEALPLFPAVSQSCHGLIERLATSKTQERVLARLALS